MGVDKNELWNSVEALNAYCERLNRYFYANFHFEALSSQFPLSKDNTVIITFRGYKKEFQNMIYEMRSVQATALDIYMSYKDTLFSDKDFASKSKKSIDNASSELEKMNHFLTGYRIIEI